MYKLLVVAAVAALFSAVNLDEAVAQNDAGYKIRGETGGGFWEGQDQTVRQASYTKQQCDCRRCRSARSHSQGYRTYSNAPSRGSSKYSSSQRYSRVYVKQHPGANIGKGWAWKSGSRNR